jgi:endonuclease YncB( thermonuclease family)
MTAGLLEVSATLDLDQFWPTGEADADTTKVVVNTAPNSFRFRPHPGAPFQVTHAFDDATVRGRITKKPIDEHGRMTVRLEGVDAPELHYTPQALVKKSQQTAQQRELYLKWNLKYRQYLAETATLALANLLRLGGASPIDCKVVTAVDQPSEVFDTYARFVGYLTFTSPSGELVVNHWLVRNGWAFPGFYSSMSADEITVLIDAANEAYNQGAVLWSELSDDTGQFDFDLVYRGKNALPDAPADQGDVLLPKLFRRVAEWNVNKRAKMTTQTFKNFLRTKSSDFCFDTAQFLEQGASASEPVHLADLINSAGMFTRWPEEVVFQEAPTTITGPGGDDVTW